MRNIRLGLTIDGLVRKESYELPLEAIREMIINAHCHRNLTDDSCVQVAVYDDRLEVTSKNQESIGEESEKHRRRIKKTSEDHPNNSRDNLNSTQKQILELLSQDTRLSAKKIAGAIGISSRNIESNIKKLKRRGILIRHGSPKNGYWEITDRTEVLKRDSDAAANIFLDM